LIEGRPGTGKTAVACAVVSTLLLEPQPVGKAMTAIYESEAGIYDAIRQSKHLEADQRNIAKEARNVRVLIIDDLGSQNETPGWCKDVLQSIIMHRYDKRLPTICTTNLSTQNLEKMYGERTVSRIMDSVGPMHVKFNNETWRSSGSNPRTVSKSQNKSGF
jgi:DNA replication protein DnaC